MKNPEPEYIKVTKEFQKVLEAFSKQLFAEIKQTKPESEEELQELINQIFATILYPVELSGSELKYNEPKLQLTKSGPVGDTSYANPQEMQDYGRRMPKVVYKPTLKRKIQTDRMKPANLAWQSASQAIKDQWNAAADEFPFYGVHLFKGCYMFLLGDNQPIPEPFLPTPELLAYYRSKKTKS